MPPFCRRQTHQLRGAQNRCVGKLFNERQDGLGLKLSQAFHVFRDHFACAHGENLSERQMMCKRASSYAARQLASSRHAGKEIRESALAKAQPIAEAELEALGWTVK
jgi:hypothetical protein